MKRRAVISALAAATAVGALPIANAAGTSATNLRRRLPAAVLETLSRIGLRYLEQQAESSSEGGLRFVTGPAGVLELTPGELKLRAEADYANGRVELVDGWVLSRTEIQLCVLVATLA